MSTSVINLVDGVLIFKQIPVVKLHETILGYNNKLDDSGKTIEETFDKFIDIATDKELNSFTLHENYVNADEYTHYEYDYNDAFYKLEQWWDKYKYDLCPFPEYADASDFLTGNNSTNLMIEDGKVFLFYNNHWLEIGDVLNPLVCEEFIDFYHEVLRAMANCAYDYLTFINKEEEDDEEDAEKDF